MMLAIALGVLSGTMSFGTSGGDLPNELLGYFNVITETQIQWWANVFSGMAATASFILIVCAWTPLWLETPDAATLGRQFDAIRLVLNAGMTLLVTAVLEIAALYRWPATLVADAKTSEALAAAATAQSLYAGVTFSLILIALYMPPAYALRNRASMLAVTRQDDAIEKLVSSKGFDDSVGQQLLRFAQALAPLIGAIPVGQMLGVFSTQ